MSSSTRRLAAAFAVLLGSLVILPLSASRASAEGEERIQSYDVAMTVGKDDSMRVTETIKYDFGDAYDKHGIYRYLTTRMGYDKRHRRLYPVDDVRVSSPSGAPADVETVREDDQTYFRIGDPDQTVDGVQTYRISYRVKGVLNGFSDHDELYWNVLGGGSTGFDVPIDTMTAEVELPGEVTRERCTAGDVGSQGACASESKTGDKAAFRANSLEPDQAFTVVLAMPKGSATTTKPILQEIPSWRTDFSPSIPNGIGAVGVLGVGALLFALLRRKRRRAGAAAASVPGQPRESSLRTRDDGTVEFVPPGGLRPGEVGTLIDESADTVDVTATIVDLAVRGYLVIDELPDKDWGLRMVKQPGPELLPYEKMFFDQLFLDKPDRVTLSALKNTFARTLAVIKGLMQGDMRKRGWFASRKPRSSRLAWRVLGIVLLAVSVFGWMLAVDTQHRSFGIGWTLMLLLGVGIIVGAGMIPGRTASGLAALADVHAFREEMTRLDFAALPEQSRDEVMSRYLPYTMAFGQTNQWTAAFARLEELARQDARYRGYRFQPYWYYGSMHNGWDAHAFQSSLNSFSTSTSSVMASTPSSSGSSGFSGGGGFSSGGGGGGGGGGSW